MIAFSRAHLQRPRNPMESWSKQERTGLLVTLLILAIAILLP